MRYILILLCSFFLIAARPDGGGTPDPIEIEHDQTLNFGGVVKPAAGSEQVVVTRQGNLGSGTTALMLKTTNISSGENTIIGSKDDSVQILLENCSGNSSMGLELMNFEAKYKNNIFTNLAAGLDAPGKGIKLTYGATLRINNNVPSGALSPCYNIIVNYE